MKTLKEKCLEVAYAHYEGESCTTRDADRLADEVAKLVLEEKERYAKLAESPGCSCRDENTHDGCCGACGSRIAKAIREAT